MIETIIQLTPVLIIVLFIYLLYRLRYDCFRLEKGKECYAIGKLERSGMYQPIERIDSIEQLKEAKDDE